MLKKTLLTAASAVVVTCGAMSVAHAGQLKLRLIDVNIQEPDYPDTTKHIDKDYDVDVNGSSGPNGAGFPINSRSVDKGFVSEIKPEGTFSHVVLADERMGGVDNPVGGWYEVEVFEITGASTFGEAARFDIFLEGDALPMFKADVNCANAIRAGTDQVHSISAQTASGGQSIKDGETTANCTVITQDGDGVLFPDKTVGWTLPIETKACGDLIVRMVVTRADPIDGNLVDEVSHRIQTCEDSLKSAFYYFPVKIDYFADFRSFLIDPDYYDGKEEHVASLWAHTGAMAFDIHHFLVDLKEDNKESQTNVFDLSDIASYELQISFEDLTGIQKVELYNGDVWSIADLDRVNNTANWYFNTSEVGEQFCLEYADGYDKGTKDEGCVNWIKIHAFGPKSTDPYNGPIDHQIAVVTKSEFNLTPDTCSGDHCVKFFTPEVEGVGSQVAQLNKTGITFGPFDWATQAGANVVGVFRVTGIPEDLKANLKGDIKLENVSEGPQFKGTWKVNYPDVSGSHDLIITPTRLRDMLLDAGMPDNADWGRADITFTFYVGGQEGKKMDMDRLLNSNGIWADYGDNGNDGNSLKARSCDDGRFGPHVANKLDPRFTYLLTGLCSIGELSRYGIYYD